MSDPLKTSDIEDVLSSIRRLVSEEARPKPASVAPSDPGKLVLTPALRVQAPITDHDDPESENLDQSEDLGQDLGQDIGAQEDAAVPADAPLNPGMPILDEAEMPSPSPQVEDVPAADRPETAALEWEDHQPDHAEPAMAETPSDAPETPGISADEPGDDAGPDSQEEAPQDWSGTLYGAAGVPEEQAVGASDPKPRAQPEDDTPFDFLAEDDGLIDEEALRELVSEIVRQELQGALGERITRNVRKLVRREIHRALSAQEFD